MPYIFSAFIIFIIIMYIIKHFEEDRESQQRYEANKNQLQQSIKQTVASAFNPTQDKIIYQEKYKEIQKISDFLITAYNSELSDFRKKATTPEEKAIIISPQFISLQRSRVLDFSLGIGSDVTSFGLDHLLRRFPDIYYKNVWEPKNELEYIYGNIRYLQANGYKIKKPKSYDLVRSKFLTNCRFFKDIFIKDKPNL